MRERGLANCGADGADQETFRLDCWRATQTTRCYPNRVAIEEGFWLLKHKGGGRRTLRKQLVQQHRQKTGGHGGKFGRGKLGGGVTDQAIFTAAVFSTQAAAEIQTVGGDRQAQKEPDQQPSEWNSAHGAALRQSQWDSSNGARFSADGWWL